jgi:hypothetical protein
MTAALVVFLEEGQWWRAPSFRAAGCAERRLRRSCWKRLRWCVKLTLASPRRSTMAASMKHRPSHLGDGQNWCTGSGYGVVELTWREQSQHGSLQGAANALIGHTTRARRELSHRYPPLPRHPLKHPRFAAGQSPVSQVQAPIQGSSGHR